MKVCPTCDKVYDDRTLSFCLMDGTPLVDGAAQATVAMNVDPAAETVAMNTPATAADTIAMTEPAPSRPSDSAAKRRSKLPWVVLGIVAFLVLAGLTAFLVSRDIRRGAKITANRAARNAANGKAVTMPSPAATDEDQYTSEPLDDPNDEVTPIQWTTAASTFKQETGRTYTFECPPDGTAGLVWGSDIYTADSSICTAAVHAGKITLDKGGEVTIEFRPGRSTYGATTRNGITTYNFGEFQHSIVFK